MLAAANQTAGVEVIYVDNGSSDGSREFVAEHCMGCCRLLTYEHATIARVRNWGAQQAAGEILCFLDADCGVDVDYFDQVLATLDTTGADATGCEVALPDHAHWIERALAALHYVGRDRYVGYINSANFAIRRAAFDAVSGFREDLTTGEDSDIGLRLTSAGKCIYESTRVRAVHFGNPKSVRQHYRRSVWHALGMFATVTTNSLDRPTLMLFIHLLATIAGAAVLFQRQLSVAERVLVLVGLQLVAPLATVVYRIGQTRRLPRIDAAVFLYWLYYWARAHALVLLMVGRTHAYRK